MSEGKNCPGVDTMQAEQAARIDAHLNPCSTHHANCLVGLQSAKNGAYLRRQLYQLAISSRQQSSSTIDMEMNVVVGEPNQQMHSSHGSRQ